MKLRIAMVLLLLFGGAIVNVAVAWGTFATARERPPFFEIATERFVLDDHVWEVEVFDHFSWTTVQWIRTRSGAYNGDVIVKAPPQLLGASFVQSIALHDDVLMGLYEVDGYGWPSPSIMSCMTNFVPIDREAGLVEQVLYGHPTSDGSFTRLFPTQPLLPGFIINTLFYALLLWLLFFAPFAARRMLRRRRGLCEKCAYPIGTWGGTVCTECGADVLHSRKSRDSTRRDKIGTVPKQSGTDQSQ